MRTVQGAKPSDEASAIMRTVQGAKPSDEAKAIKRAVSAMPSDEAKAIKRAESAMPSDEAKAIMSDEAQTEIFAGQHGSKRYSRYCLLPTVLQFARACAGVGVGCG